MKTEENEKTKEVKIILNPLEKLLCLKFNNPKFCYTNKEKVNLYDVYYEYNVRIGGIYIPLVIKTGTFYKINNKFLFLIAIIIIIFVLPLSLIITQNVLASFLFLIIFFILLKKSVKDKAFYFIIGKPKEVTVYHLNKEKSKNYSKLVIHLNNYTK